VTAERFGAVCQAAQSRACRGVSAAGAVVGDLGQELRFGAGYLQLHVGGPGVFGDVCEGLGADEVDGGLERWWPALRRHGELDGDGGAGGEFGQAGPQPGVGERGRVNAAGELAQFGPGRVEIQLGFAEFGAGPSEQAGDGGQAPLGAVAQLALELAALCVRRLDQPPPGRLDLREAGPDLGLQARVGGREPGGRGYPGVELRVVENGWVVDERGQRPVAVVDERDRPLAVLGGQDERAAGLIDVAAAFGEPVRHGQGGIGERAGQPVAQCARSRIPEIDDQPGDRRAGPAAPEKVRGQTGCDQHDDGLVPGQHHAGGHACQPQRWPGGEDGGERDRGGERVGAGAPLRSPAH
jgi:hypothetical protein